MAEALSARVRERLEQELGSHVFVGVALDERDAGEVVARLDGAAAEASAQLLGGRRTKSLASRTTPKKASRPQKPGKSPGSRARGRR